MFPLKRFRSRHFGALAGFLLYQTAVAAGLQADIGAMAWPSWQLRLQLSVQTLQSASGVTLVPATARGASLLGDYYLHQLPLGPQSSFRLTSGLLVGTRDALVEPNLARPAWSSALGSGLVSLSRSQVQSARPVDNGGEALVTRPYLGLGYSAGDRRAGWGFSADLGLAGQGSEAPKLGATQNGQGLDELLRSLRLQPVLQLGVSYSF